MINFAEIKNNLVNAGLVTQEMAEAAQQTVIIVDGECNDDETVDIQKISAGFVVGDFNKCLKINSSAFTALSLTEKALKQHLQSQFPDAKIILKIQ